MKRLTSFGLMLAGGLIVGCGSDPSTTQTPADSGTNPTDLGTNPADSGTNPVDSGTNPVDSGTNPEDTGTRTDSGRPDGGAGSMCGTLPVTNLNTAGMRMGDTTRVSGDTTEAWTAQNPGGTVRNSSPINPPSSNTTCSRSRGQVVYSYTTGAMPAALRITTTNDGTVRAFDTVLWVTSACRTTLSSAACNDDDPAYAASTDRRVSSAVITEVLPANTTLYVILGGFYPPSTGGVTIDHGRYELSVQELPPVAMGGACRTDGQSMRCGTGLDCVGADPGADMGTCRTEGSVPGATCRTFAPECDSGLTCSTNGFCQRTVTAGMPCDAFNACETGATCIGAAFGAIRGTCVAVGTAVGSACRPVGAMGGRCDSPLVCDGDSDSTITNPTCLQPVALGAACDIRRTHCAMGSSCVTLNGSSFIGTCRADGTAARANCRAASPRCDGTLQCLRPGDTGTERCINVAAVGAACDSNSDCPDSSTCYLTDLNNRTAGVCGADGGRGGACRATAPLCDAMLTCSNPDGNGLCQTVATMGMPCSRPGTTCGDGLSCVLNAGSQTTGTCQPDGSVAGSACRSGDMPCVAGLTCSGTALSAGVCQRAAMAGGACDPINSSTRCPDGQVCRVTAYNAGTCAAPTRMETEPNDSPAAVMSSPVSEATVITSSLPFGDVDCVAVTVAAMGHIVASVSDGNGRCPVPFTGSTAGITLDVYGPETTTLRGTSSLSGPAGCATIDGARTEVFPFAANLAAGTYYVCARGYRDTTTNTITGAVSRYYLSVAAGN